MSLITASITAEIGHAVPQGWTVTASAQAAVTIAVDPATAINAQADRLVVVLDDETYEIHHQNHNGVERGCIKLSGSLTGMVGTVVRELLEGF